MSQNTNLSTGNQFFSASFGQHQIVKGNPGDSAYQVAVKNGFKGTEEEWLSSLKGDKGDTGPSGPQGVQGVKGDVGPVGPEGKTGATGPQGPAGPTGPQGIQGPKGDKGDQGPKGEQGPVGTSGLAGKDGVSPVLSIGTVTTLPAGDQATATMTGTAANPVLNLGLPRGEGSVTPPASVDLTDFDSAGKIVETYPDGSIVTYTMEFDDDGNPTKITDSNGNVTNLIGFEFGGGGNSATHAEEESF